MNADCISHLRPVLRANAPSRRGPALGERSEYIANM